MEQELSRRIQALESGHQELRTQFAVSEERSKAVASDVKEIRDSMKWLVRLILGGLIMSAVGFLVAGGFSP